MALKKEVFLLLLFSVILVMLFVFMNAKGNFTSSRLMSPPLPFISDNERIEPNQSMTLSYVSDNEMIVRNDSMALSNKSENKTIGPNDSMALGYTSDNETMALSYKQTIRPKESMALSLEYWEQTGNALQNLFALQCWAGTVNISGVVEPSIKPSWDIFYFVYDGSRYTFRDMFDVSHWNQMSLKYGASSLVALEHFIKYGFRNIVFVQITYGMYKGVHCKTLATIANTSWAQFLIRKGFNFTKNVCLNFKVNSSFTQESFRESILGGTDHRVTVLFDQFNGIRQSGGASRLVVEGPLCHIDEGKMRNFDASSKLTQIQYIPVNSSARVVPSQRIIGYVNRFISEQMSGEKYIAVMLRTEKLKQVIRNMPDNDTCANAIITDWNEMVTRHNIHKTLLFSDINTHGSKGWTKDPVATQFSNYVHDTINLTMNLNMINSVLEGMTESQDNMQIAVLHRQLVTHATCVVVVGGGIFQEQALNMYFHNHRGHECYTYRTGRCLPSYVNIVYGL